MDEVPEKQQSKRKLNSNLHQRRQINSNLPLNVNNIQLQMTENTSGMPEAMKQKMMEKGMGGLQFQKVLQQQTDIGGVKRTKIFDENVNKYDLKYLQDYEQDGNDNSYTLFDKSLQEPESGNPSIVDPLIGNPGNALSLKHKELTNLRRSVSLQSREVLKS